MEECREGCSPQTTGLLKAHSLLFRQRNLISVSLALKWLLVVSVALKQLSFAGASVSAEVSLIWPPGDGDFGPIEDTCPVRCLRTESLHEGKHVWGGICQLSH